DLVGALDLGVVVALDDGEQLAVLGELDGAAGGKVGAGLGDFPLADDILGVVVVGGGGEAGEGDEKAAECEGEKPIHHAILLWEICLDRPWPRQRPTWGDGKKRRPPMRGEFAFRR